MSGLKEIFNSPELIKRKKVIHNAHDRAAKAIGELGLDEDVTKDIYKHITKNYVSKVQEIHNDVTGEDVDITPPAKEGDAEAAAPKKSAPSKGTAKKGGKKSPSSELD